MSNFKLDAVKTVKSYLDTAPEGNTFTVTVASGMDVMYVSEPIGELTEAPAAVVATMLAGLADKLVHGL